ncbi:MAG: hypothetical protein IKD86_07025 [Firmicutes bacterium]|nr:hypothetical protein [Bacillota bacterium]
MICPICKSNIRDGSTVCPVCGKTLQQDAPEIHKIETVESPKAAENTPSPVPEQNQPAPEQGAGRPQAAEMPKEQGAARPQTVGMSPEQGTVRPQSPGAPQNQGGVRPQAADNRPAFEAAQNRPASEAEVRNSRNGMPENRNFQNAGPQGNPPYMGNGRQNGPGQGPSGRNYQPYQQNIPPQGQHSRGPSQHRPAGGMNTVQKRPLSEKEYDLLRRNLSIKSMIAFICGIFGICSGFFNLPFSIVGLVMSIIVRNEYKNRNFQQDTDLKLANVGFICCIIGIVVGAIALITILISGAGIISALSSLTSSTGGYYGY